jgi:hypothetical protein
MDGPIRELPALTVGALREAIALLSDDHPILVENYGFMYDLVNARAIGLRTDDPGLVLRIRQVRPPF